MDRIVLYYAEKVVNGELTDADELRIAGLGIASAVADAAYDLAEAVSALTDDDIIDDEDGGELVEA